MMTTINELSWLLVGTTIFTAIGLLTANSILRYWIKSEFKTNYNYLFKFGFLLFLIIGCISLFLTFLTTINLIIITYF